ncbi:surface-associated interspersed protein 4.2 (SURFIN 4.2) [Plasmodium gaboni]|uniref:Surface-associated interspersed protein 4.2 (SURFIN 4.2) n=1 Tax=Plasmodium gaboni TaxID=647221 RepID=A0A151LUT6_9APIC|nr:surface-associated interspersed protein 4.2 (SURFIN 4.2) [Plasmodium gaboni]KYO02928.1 surface-associated interspersed protein 4.2 (SURFIN 4.2) [Plasmodium gaboni]
MLFVVESDSRLEEWADKRISVDRFREIFEIYIEDKLEELKKARSKKFDKDCRDFNYFMDDVKDVFINNDLVKIPIEARKSIWEKNVDNNLPTLMKKTTNCKCIRKEHKYDKEYRDMTQTLENFCEEKTRKLNRIDKKDYVEGLCTNFNIWINNKKEKILEQYKKLSKIEENKHLLKVSETCDLNNVDNLFANISCEVMKKNKEEARRKHPKVKERRPVNESIRNSGKENTQSRRPETINLKKKNNSPIVEIGSKSNTVSETSVGSTISHSESRRKTVSPKPGNGLKSDEKISDKGPQTRSPQERSIKKKTRGHLNNVSNDAEKKGRRNSHVISPTVKKTSDSHDKYKNPSSNYIEVDCTEGNYFLLKDGNNNSEDICKTNYDYSISNDYSSSDSFIYSTGKDTSRNEIKTPDSLPILLTRENASNVYGSDQISFSHEGNSHNGEGENNNVNMSEHEVDIVEGSVRIDDSVVENEEEVAAVCDPDDKTCVDASKIPVEVLKGLSTEEYSDLEGSSDLEHLRSKIFGGINIFSDRGNLDFDILIPEEEVSDEENSDIIHEHEEVEEINQAGTSIIERHSHTSSQYNDTSTSDNKYRILSTAMEFDDHPTIFGFYSPLSEKFYGALNFLKGILSFNNSLVSQSQGQHEGKKLEELQTSIRAPKEYKSSSLHMNDNNVGAGINKNGIFSILGLTSENDGRNTEEGTETYLTGSSKNGFNKIKVIRTFKGNGGENKVLSNEKGGVLSKGGILSKGVTSMITSLPVALVTFVFLFMFLAFNKMNPFGTILVQGKKKKKKKVKEMMDERRKPKRRSARQRRAIDVNVEDEINKVIYKKEFNNYENINYDDKIYEEEKYIKVEENEIYLREGIEELHIDDERGDVHFDDENVPEHFSDEHVPEHFDDENVLEQFPDQHDYLHLDHKNDDVGLDEPKSDILSKELFDDVPIKVEGTEVNREIPLKKKEWMWKIILDIEMKVIEKCKKKEWEESKGDFLEICLDEFIKKENEYKKLNNKVIVETNVLENQNMLWNKWIERHRYMLEKWKKEEWFYNLKNEWINEIKNYEKTEGDIEITLPSEKEKRNIYLEKQKIIWRRWVARYVQHIDDNIIEAWFKKMMEEYEKEEYYLNKNRYKIINHIKNKNDKHDESVQYDDKEKLISSTCFDIEEKQKKKLLTKIWIQIHMMILEEYKKDEYIRIKNLLLDNYIDKLKKANEVNVKNSLQKLDILIEMKKENNMIQTKERNKWEGEKWFVDLNNEWNDYERGYIKNNFIIKKENAMNRYENIIHEPLLKVKKDIPQIHWKYINEKWLHDEYDYEYEYIPENIIDKNKLVLMEKKVKWKTIIEIYMEAMNEYKKDEWEESRGDFLQICLEEFIKKDNEDMNNINDELPIEQSENIEDMLMLERQKIIWLQWIKRNKYMLQKWNKEEWFHKLKKDWKDEMNRYDQKLFLFKNKESDKSINPMLERQKYIWRKWIAKHLYHLDDWEDEEWFNLLMNKYEKDKDDLRRDRNNKMDDMEKKKLITKLFIEIHMMVIEDSKEEECFMNKENFVNTYINELKKEEACEKNREMLHILNNIKNDIKLGYENTKLNEWKQEKWFDNLKKAWKEGEYKKNFVDIEKENFDLTQINIINNYMLEIQRSLLKKYWEDIEISWIDDDNQTDWLKIAINLNDYDNNNKKKVCNRRYDYMRNENLHIKKKKNIINEEHISEDNKCIYQNNHSYIKRIIEIYMERVNEIKKKEWEENKWEFLKIALEEYIQIQFKKQKNLCIEEIIIKNKNTNDDNNGYLEQTFLWNQWIERKRYIMKKWKYEKWFEELKIEWIKEQGIYIKEEEIETFIKDEEKTKIINNNNESNNNNNNNDILIQSEKIVWKRWLKKQEKNIQIYKNQKWFKDIIVEFEKDEQDDMIMYSNINDITKINNKELDVNYRDNLIMNIWMCIYMMILEECKKDEGIYNKEIFLNSFIEEIKKEKDEKTKMNMLDLILEMKEKYISKNEKDFYIYDRKKEKCFESLKNDYKNDKNEYLYMIQNDLFKRQRKDLDKVWLENEDKKKRDILTNIYEEYNNMNDLSKKEYIDKNINIINKKEYEMKSNISLDEKSIYNNTNSNIMNENMKYNSEIEKRDDENTVEGIQNYYLEKQKEIWRQWIDKNVKHINQSNKEEEQILVGAENNKIVDSSDCKKNEKNYMKKKNMKKVFLAEIHMEIMDRHNPLKYKGGDKMESDKNINELKIEEGESSKTNYMDKTILQRDECKKSNVSLLNEENKMWKHKNMKENMISYMNTYDHTNKFFGLHKNCEGGKSIYQEIQENVEKRYIDDIYLLKNEKDHTEFNTHTGEKNYDFK